MKQWLKILLIVFAVVAVSEVFGQGCAQCKQKIEQSSVDADDIGYQANPDAQRAILWYYIGIPALIVTTTLLIVFRKKIASLFRSKHE